MLQNPTEFQTPIHSPPPMPWPGADHPPPAETTTLAELGAAVAALPGMKDALREAFDSLAACSPNPLPFAWVDLDAHVSEVQSAISLRFRQVRALESARAARTAAAAALEGTRGDGIGGNLEEEEVEDEEVVEEEKEQVLGVEEVVVEEEEVVEVEEEDKAVEEELEEVMEEEEVQEVVESEDFVEEEDEKGDEEMHEADNEDADDEIGKDGKDEEAREVVQEDEVEELADGRIGNDIKDDKEATGDEQYANEVHEEMKMADEEMQSTEDGDKSSQDKEQDANMEEGKTTEGTNKAPQVKEEDANMEDEQDTDMEEALAKNASAMQCKEEEACGENQEGEEHLESHKGEEVAKNAMLEETMVAKEVSLDQRRSLPGGSNDHTAACTNMDAQRLVKLLFTNSGLNLELHTALHRAPDAAALALHLVELFLHDKMLKTNKAWVNCVGLIRMVPVVVTELSADTIELAKPVAKDWKEMIDNSENCTVLGNLASWGFLYFIISYNIVSEFETKEIFRLFGTMPRKQQKMNYAMLFKGLRLTDRIPELLDYLIENGQQLDVLYWAHVFNLVDKYPAVSLLKGYIEKAKQTAIEISQKNMTSQSLSVVIKELDNLRRAQDLADQQITDSSLSTSIREEISNLLGEFGKRKRSLAKSCTTSTSKSQQQHMEGNKKQKEEEEHHEGQENQQQGQHSKPGEKLEKKLDKPQQKQKQKQKQKHKQKQKQKQKEEYKPQHTPKLPAQASPTAQNAPLRGHFGHPTYATIHGVYQGYPAQPGVYCAPPFAPQLGAPENIGSFNPFYPHPEFYP